jgi:hypothetical protein
LRPGRRLVTEEPFSLQDQFCGSRGLRPLFRKCRTACNTRRTRFHGINQDRLSPRDTGIQLLGELVAVWRNRRRCGEQINRYQIVDVAQAAIWLDLRDVADELRAWLAGIPTSEPARGLITNVPIANPEVLRPTIGPPEVYDEGARQEIIAKFRRFADVDAFRPPSVRYQEALATASNDYIRECILVTMAFEADGDAAIAMATSNGLLARRQLSLGILQIVTTVERARRLEPTWDRLLPALTGESSRLYVLRGLVGLPPWGGYPFADY